MTNVFIAPSAVPSGFRICGELVGGPTSRATGAPSEVRVGAACRGGTVGPGGLPVACGGHTAARSDRATVSAPSLASGVVAPRPPPEISLQGCGHGADTPSAYAKAPHCGGAQGIDYM